MNSLAWIALSTLLFPVMLTLTLLRIVLVRVIRLMDVIALSICAFMIWLEPSGEGERRARETGR